MTETTPIHPLFRDKPPPEAKLWRYLSFAKFAALLDTSKLHFTRVDQFDDHFEGAWPQQDVARWKTFKGLDVPTFTEGNRKFIAISCWIESKFESAAMWRLYAPGNEGVAIATSFQKLDDLVTSQGPVQLPGCLAGTGRVRYLDHFTEGLLDQGGPQNALLPFMLKNVSYSHECEVRAFLHSALVQKIPEDGLDLPVQLASFVEEIITSPFSQPWFDKTVRGVADRYGLADRIRSSTLAPSNFYIAR